MLTIAGAHTHTHTLTSLNPAYLLPCYDSLQQHWVLISPYAETHRTSLSAGAKRERDARAGSASGPTTKLMKFFHSLFFLPLLLFACLLSEYVGK